MVSRRCTAPLCAAGTPVTVMSMNATNQSGHPPRPGGVQGSGDGRVRQRAGEASGMCMGKSTRPRRPPCPIRASEINKLPMARARRGVVSPGMSGVVAAGHGV